MGPVLLACVYMPCDTADQGSIEDYISTICKLKALYCLLLPEPSELRRWKPNARSRSPSTQKQTIRYYWKFFPQNERASRVGCLSPEFYRKCMLQSQSRVCFRYVFVHNGSNFPLQLVGWSVLHSTPFPEYFDCVDNSEQIVVVCRCTEHEFVTELPKRHVEIFHLV